MIQVKMKVTVDLVLLTTLVIALRSIFDSYGGGGSQCGPSLLFSESAP
jgi:hypothetical protein